MPRERERPSKEQVTICWHASETAPTPKEIDAMVLILKVQIENEHALTMLLDTQRQVMWMYNEELLSWWYASLLSVA